MATKSKPKTAKTEKRDVGILTLLLKIVKGKDLLKRPKDATLFSQGEKADAIYFVQTGKVQLTVVSPKPRRPRL
jgi:CRP-like cAMP-binding protein